MIAVVMIDMWRRRELGTYQRILDLKDIAGGRGYAKTLAETHLLAAVVSPRVDLRAVHVDHAKHLAKALGQTRIEAYALAAEAHLELNFGENEGAEELGLDALDLATAVGNPAAQAYALLCLGAARRRLGQDEADTSTARALAIATEAQAFEMRLHALTDSGKADDAKALATDAGIVTEGWGID